MKNFLRIFVLCLALSVSIAHATSTDENSLDSEMSLSEDEVVDLPKAKSKTEAASLSDCDCEIPDAKPLASKKSGVNQTFAQDLKKSIADTSKDDLDTTYDENSESFVATRKSATTKNQTAMDAATLNALYMAAYQQGYQQAQMAAMYAQQYNSMNSNPGVTTLTNSLASMGSSLNSGMGSTALVSGTYPTFSMYTPNSAMYSGMNSSSPGVLPALSMNNYGGYNYNAYGTNGVLAAPTYSSYGTTASGVLPAPTTGSMYPSSMGMMSPGSYNYPNVAMNGYPNMMGPQMRNPYMGNMNGYGNSGCGISAGLNIGFGMGY